MRLEFAMHRFNAIMSVLLFIRKCLFNIVDWSWCLSISVCNVSLINNTLLAAFEIDSMQ